MMGYEIRRVIPGWKHPKFNGQYKPLHDQSCEEAWAEWRREFENWIEPVDCPGDQPGDADFRFWCMDFSARTGSQPYTEFCHRYGTPPDPEDYRPQWAEGEATWRQVYETVSYGTPVTPPFASWPELVDYLVANGDFWDQTPWSREQAEKFVTEGQALSFVADSRGVRTGVEAL